MEREMEWNTEVTKIHHTNYVRNSRAITVAWFVFSACYTILNVVAFIQPFWFGDTNESPGVGYFGLYEFCERVQGSDYRCQGDFLDFTSIGNNWFRASSFMVGMAALLFIFSIICMLLFLFLKAATVLRVCGWMQLLAAIMMAVACIILPNAFDDINVRRICGVDATAYNMDKCQIRWGYILAIVLIFDALILAVLAFVLAARQAKMIPEIKKQPLEDRKYIHEWTDQEFTNQGYSDPMPSPVPVQTQQTFIMTTQQQHNLPPLETSHNRVMNQPIIIPVDNFGDSPRSDSSHPARTSSPPSQQELNLELSPRSEVSDVSPRMDEVSPRSEDLSMSPRSEDVSLGLGDMSPRSEDISPRSDETSRQSRSSPEGSVRSRKSNASAKSDHSRKSDRSSSDIHL